MSDTTTITPEERARLRSILSEHSNPPVEDRIILRLLNTAEQAEAEVARLTKMVDWLANKLIDCPSEFTNCAVDCAECRKEAARRAVAAGEE